MARKLLDDHVPLALWMATGDTLWELAAAAHHRRVPSVPIVFHRYIQCMPVFHVTGYPCAPIKAAAGACQDSARVARAFPRSSIRLQEQPC